MRWRWRPRRLGEQPTRQDACQPSLVSKRCRGQEGRQRARAANRRSAERTFPTSDKSQEPPQLDIQAIRAHILGEAFALRRSGPCFAQTVRVRGGVGGLNAL